MDMGNKKKGPGGRPLLFNNCLDLDAAIELFFEECEEKEWVPTVTGLAVALNTNRWTINNYSKRDEFFTPVNRARIRIEMYVEQQLFAGKSPKGAMFNLSNNFSDWKEKQEVDQKTEHSLSDKTQKFLKTVTNENAERVWKK